METVSKKLIFLDFDGVLNSMDYFEKWVKENGHNGPNGRVIDQLDPAMVARLNKIVDATGADVVISSTWRIMHTLTELRGILGNFGYRHSNIISKTPQSLSGYRGHEIDCWLSDNESRGYSKFIILDDGSDMEPHQDRLIQTSWDKGMQDEHMIKAIEMLNE